ncbi:hypothetical protein E4U12_007724 [Claviceps purpurea]|nr:hypothetical protein E4U12_007724 [Claviceps purpurea]
MALILGTIPFDELYDGATDEEDLEDLELLGGVLGDFYPVDIDDRLNERYRIVHKLGSGPFSEVWLAIHEETHKYVAIKVGIAQSDGSEGQILTKISHILANSKIGNDKKLLVPTLLDRFEISGPKGTHPCLVTLPAQCTLENAKFKASGGLFQLDVARSLAAQLAIAVSIVHKNGYAHGDLDLRNVLLQLPASLDDLSVEKLYETYGRPEKWLVEDIEPKAASPDLSVPTCLVCPGCLIVPGHEITLAEAKLTLSNFRTAFRPADKSRFVSQADRALRPPEVLLEPETPLDFASDIWSLGCLIFSLLGGDSLIQGCWVRPGEITAQQVELSGHMPPEWWRRWEERPEWYTEDGEPLFGPEEARPWERRFEESVQKPRETSGMETLAEDELAAVLKLLRDILAWKPSERPNISKVLKSDWMTRWALPAYQNGSEKQKHLKEPRDLEVLSDLQAPKDTTKTLRKRKA